ncbi:MAG TPA: type II toxin-antitoxin system VapC family toxin [Gemmatimonadaceae bacterium]|nr:type II toxin-antitoxin system VapC family toxin [Gemmatimonadaceae bacterium]
MRYLLDTDTCVWVLRERDPVFSRVRGTSPDDLAIATTTEAELRYGALHSREPVRNLVMVEAFTAAPISVLPFDRRAARVHAELRVALRTQPIGERDLVIASVALAHGLAVVTGNVHEFARVPGLAVEDWTRGRTPA